MPIDNLHTQRIDLQLFMQQVIFYMYKKNHDQERKSWKYSLQIIHFIENDKQIWK